LWDGGLVLYGALVGGALGYFGFWWFALRPKGISNWKMVDVVAPCLALGIAFGRIGCLCTGCCYGNVACGGCPAIHFPLYTNTSPVEFTGASREMIKRGHQTALGFTFHGDLLEVAAVEPGSAADDIVEPGDEILEINGIALLSQRDLWKQEIWRPFGELQMKVLRNGRAVDLPSFVPTSIGVNPTQIYETISMCLLLFFLLSYYPYKRHDGEVLVLFMVGYGLHRFLNEMLRTDTTPVAFGMTLSQNVSLLVLAFAAVLATIVWRRPTIGQETPAPVPATELVPTK
jgi:prolipoprotein diacylglyceryltransferase